MPLRADIHSLQAAIAIETGDAVNAVEHAQKQVDIRLQLAKRQFSPEVAGANTELAMALLVAGRYGDAGVVMDDGDDAVGTREGVVTGSRVRGWIGRGMLLRGEVEGDGGLGDGGTRVVEGERERELDGMVVY